MRSVSTLSRLCMLSLLVLAASATTVAAQRAPVLPTDTRVRKPTQPGGGQVAPYNVYGTIKDLDGKVMPNVDVSFSNADNGSKIAVVKTDAKGEYTRSLGVPGNQTGYYVVPSMGPYKFEPGKAHVTKTGRVDFVIQRSANSKG